MVWDVLAHWYRLVDRPLQWWLKCHLKLRHSFASHLKVRNNLQIFPCVICCTCPRTVLLCLVLFVSLNGFLLKIIFKYTFLLMLLGITSSAFQTVILGRHSSCSCWTMTRPLCGLHPYHFLWGSELMVHEILLQPEILCLYVQRHRKTNLVWHPPHFALFVPTGNWGRPHWRSWLQCFMANKEQLQNGLHPFGSTRSIMGRQ